MRLSYFDKINRFYFIGIGGISMSALAKFLLACGYEVSGSDMNSGEQTVELLFSGVKIHFGANADHPDLQAADAVIYTSAIPENHEELVAARKLGKILWKRSENSSAYTNRLELSTNDKESEDVSQAPLQDIRDQEDVVVRTVNSDFKPMRIVGSMFSVCC